MPYRVLHILRTADPRYAGRARSVGQLAKGIDAKRYTMSAWFLADRGPMEDELRAARIEVESFRWRGGFRDPAGALRFWRRLRGEDFDIIHQHFGGRSLRVIASHCTSAKILVHLFGVDESPSLTPIRLSLRSADAAIAVSKSLAEAVVGMEPCVIYPGIPVANSAEAVPRVHLAPVIGTAARLAPVKGIHHLIRAMHLLRLEFPTLRLEIAGAGPERASLEAEVRALNLEDCVVFLGWQDDVRAVMASWDVFVVPSLNEGLGLATLEAMAAGLPVVASGVGGLTEVVQDGHTGWLVPPACPTALAERVRFLLRNPEQGRTMGCAGQLRVRDQFSIDRMVRATVEVYDRLLGISPWSGS